MSIDRCYNFDDFRKLAKKNYPLQFFIILMEVQMMKLHLVETQKHLTTVI